MQALSFYNTYLTFGLTSAERDYLEENQELAKLYRIECKEFSDLLAIPAFMILIRFESLTENELELFNECFVSSDTMIFSLSETPYNKLSYYADFDFKSNNLKQLQLSRKKLIIEKYKKTTTVFNPYPFCGKLN